MRDSVCRLALELNCRLSIPAGARQTLRVEDGVKLAISQSNDLCPHFRFGADLSQIFTLHEKIGTGILGIENGVSVSRVSRPDHEEREQCKHKDALWLERHGVPQRCGQLCQVNRAVVIAV